MSADLARAALWPVLVAMLPVLFGVAVLTYQARARRRIILTGVLVKLLAVVGLVISAMTGLFSCGSARAPSPTTRQSVFQLECWHDNEQVPCCNAFAVRKPSGLVLLTAAHCLRGLAVHEKAYYASRAEVQTWVNPPVHRARVGLVDLNFDRAELTPDDPEGLEPLEVADGPPEGADVSAEGMWGSVEGKVLIRAGLGATTDLDLVPGWSGSPILDDRGRVVGMATACQSEPGWKKVCLRHSGQFISLR